MRSLTKFVIAATLTLCSFRAVASTDLDLASSKDWTFRPGSGDAAPRSIPVPGGGWQLNGFAADSEGTYERSVTVPALGGGAEQTTLLQFEAVNWEASVYAGPDAAHLKLAGIHLSAWTPFHMDISRLVTPGRTTIIRVRVRDRSHFKDAAGHFTLPAGPEWTERPGRGILRGVSLKVLPACYIESVFVRPTIADRSLSTTVTIRNAGTRAHTVHVSGAFTPAKYLSGSAPHLPAVGDYPPLPSKEVSLQPGETRTVVMGPVRWGVAKSFDWLPNVPYRSDYRAPLHNLAITASISGETLPATGRHTIQTRFGFCSHGQQGRRYTLNGIPVDLRGDSLPEATIGTDAFSRLPGFLPPTSLSGGWQATVHNYQRLNYNVVRMHQIPATSYMMDICDELGLMVITETAIRGGGVAPENVTVQPDAYMNHLRELILRDRNHPSVFKWSLENELPAIATPFLRNLYDTCMAADGTRPCSVDVFDRLPSPAAWPLFSVIDHYSQPAGAEKPAGGLDRGDYPHGEGEYVWPYGPRPQGAVWFGLETRSMRAHDNSDLRPYTLIDVWPGVISGLTPVNFPSPHSYPDSLEQGGRPFLDPRNPWSDAAIQLIQRSFAPVAAFDTEYDRVNMHSNGRGQWPVNAPTLTGGVTYQRKFEVFNDDLEGDNVKLLVLPTLKLSPTEVQPLPEISRDIHLSPGGHISMTIPVAVPLVHSCTQLNLLVIVWKHGVKRYEDNLKFVVTPITASPTFASVEFLGTDTQTGGEWVDGTGHRIYGQQAFLLPGLNGRTFYQEAGLYLSRAGKMLPGIEASGHAPEVDTSDTEIYWSAKQTEDRRVQWSQPAQTLRVPIAFQSAHQELYFRADCTDAKPHLLSIYLLDYLRTTGPVDVEIFDVEGHRLDSRQIDGASMDAGVYVKFKIQGAVYISIVTLANQETTAGGVFLDPVH